MYSDKEYVGYYGSAVSLGSSGNTSQINLAILILIRFGLMDK